MSQGLLNFRSAVETAWSGVTPVSDGSGIGYRFISAIADEGADGDHRQLLWRMPQMAFQDDLSRTQLQWAQHCELFLCRDPGNVSRSYDGWTRAAALEATQLAQAFNRLTNWGAQCQGAILEEFGFFERQDAVPLGTGGIPKSQFVKVRFAFSVKTNEGA